jgi:hypothetical protein
MPPDDQTPQSQQQPPIPRKWAGYDTPEELERGYLASSEEAKRLKAERDQYAAMFAQQQRPADTPQDWRSEAESLGVAPRLLERAFSELFQKELAPVMRGVEARPRVMAEHPDYAQYEAKVAEWLQGDQRRQATYQSMFQTDPAAAMEWSFLKFGDEERRRQPAVEEKPRRRAASEAQIPSARSGDSRREPDDRAEDQELFKRFMETRSPQDAERFAKSRLKKAIPDSFFQQG